MENDTENLDTSLCLGQVNTTASPSFTKPRSRKKSRKQSYPMSTYSPPPLYKTVKSQLQPGCLIKIEKKTELYNMFVKANWEPMLYYQNRKVLPNLVTEFYNNMEVRKGIHDVVFFTTVVDGKHLLVDHIELGKALKLTPKLLNLANVDISKNYVYDKMELKLCLSVLCGLEVPLSIIDDKGVSFEHFTPVFQTLAMIMRKNIFPSTSGDKLMSFAEIKLMYKLASHKITFNLPYMIIMHMIDSFKKGHMLYGLALTKVFEYFQINTNQLPNFQVASTISDKTQVNVLPLPGFRNLSAFVDLEPTEEVPPAPAPVPSSDKKCDEIMDFNKKFLELKESNEALEVLFKELQVSFKNLVEKYAGMEAKVNVLIEILGNTVSRAGRIEEGVSQLINAQLAMYDINFLPLIDNANGNDDPNPVMAAENDGNVRVSEPSDMETDIVNNQVLAGLEDID